MSVWKKGAGMNRLISTFIAMTLLSASAWADETEQLQVKTVVQKEAVVINDDGKEEKQLIPAETVVPGERVVYTVTIENVGNEPADDVVITQPINENLTYVDGSAFGPGMEIQFSVDGGQSFALAAELTVDAEGNDRPAQPEDFTHVRWVMQHDLPPGAQASARVAATLN